MKSYALNSRRGERVVMCASSGSWWVVPTLRGVLLDSLACASGWFGRMLLIDFLACASGWYRRGGRFMNGLFAVSLLLLLLVGCGGDGADESAVRKVFGGPGLSPGEFSYPRALTVSPVDGCLYIVDKTARIQRFSADGTYEHQWRMPEYRNGKPTSLAVDRQNRVWVADTHYARVMVFDRDGEELFRFGSAGEGPGEFVFPCAVAIDREGFVYVGEYGGNDRISKFRPDGTYVSSFADRTSGDAWVERPVGMALDEAGSLWVADSCHHRICRFDRQGELTLAFGKAGGGPGEFSYPYGLAIEKSGTLLVADRGNNRIVRFDREGRFLDSWGTAGRAVGQIAQPWGVALALRGNIYCLDSWNNRVQVINW